MTCAVNLIACSNNPDVKMNYLASPLVVAYALAGTMDIDIVGEPLGQDEQGQDVYLHDIWPSEHESTRCWPASPRWR